MPTLFEVRLKFDRESIKGVYKTRRGLFEAHSCERRIAIVRIPDERAVPDRPRVYTAGGEIVPLLRVACAALEADGDTGDYPECASSP